MRDLGAATVASTTTLFAVYVAGLVFLAQHVADRYSPLVYPRVAVRAGRLVLVGQALVVAGSLWLALIRETAWTNRGDALLIGASLVISVTGLYITFQTAADRARIIDIVQQLEPTNRSIALRDMTWTGVSRGDVTAVEMLLRTPEAGSEEQADLLSWLTDYPVLMQQSWIRQLVLATATEHGFEDSAAEQLGPALTQLLTYCLDNSLFSSAEKVLLDVVRAVDEAAEFGRNHADLLFDFGFAIHCVGEEGRSAPRVGVPAVSLDGVQEWFQSKLVVLKRAVVRHGDSASVTNFCLLLQRLSEAGIARVAVVSQIHEVLEDAYPNGALESRALEALANTIGAARGGTREDESGASFYLDDDSEYQELLNERAAHLALYIIKLGGQEHVGRMMSNARAFPISKMPRRLVTENDFDEDLYLAVARAFKKRRWSEPTPSRIR
jgi:hypothetical protein